MELRNILNIKTSAIPVILAPMAGVTDLPYRIICEKYGADFSYSEMVSAKGLSYNNINSHKLLSTSDLLKKPFGVQIFGSEPDVMADISKKLYDTLCNKTSIIDINMGCPAPKIFNNNQGCAIMGDIDLAKRIIRSVSGASPLPVSVKFRKGIGDNNINAVEFAKMAQDSGADALTVHGRTRVQMYSGQADWDIIAAVKAAVQIPVIANGDIVSGESAKQIIKHTKCDGIMIGRKAFGNPFIFEEVQNALQNKEYSTPSVKERMELAIRHASLHLQLKGLRSLVELRKHMAWYTSGIKNGGKIRQQLFACSSLQDFIEVLSAINE